MQLRLLEYFVALAREGHFARAAESCNVTQPTLSAGIAALEEQLGKRLVDRDRRYIGLTEEGAAALPWAQQAIAMIDGLNHAAEAAQGALRGTLRLGAIPAAMPVVGHFARALGAANPELVLSVRSLTSREIEQALAAFELDAGLTYLDHEPPAQVIAVPLYAERAMFVARAGRGFDSHKSVTWPEILAEPLCLLHEGMQNRRIFDANLAAHGFAVHPKATADSYVALLAMVEAGGFATVVPEGYAALIPAKSWARILPFDKPFPASRVGLVVLDRRPSSQLAQAALAAAHGLSLPRSYRNS